MAPFVKGANSYSAFLYPNNADNEARINVYCDEGHKLYILFRREAAALGTNSYNAGSKIGVAYEGITGFERYIDLLRNENPVWVTFSPDNTPPTFVVYAAREPVGEEEGGS